MPCGHWSFAVCLGPWHFVFLGTGFYLTTLFYGSRIVQFRLLLFSLHTPPTLNFIFLITSKTVLAHFLFQGLVFRILVSLFLPALSCYEVRIVPTYRNVFTLKAYHCGWNRHCNYKGQTFIHTRTHIYTYCFQDIECLAATKCHCCYRETDLRKPRGKGKHFIPTLQYCSWLTACSPLT